MVTPLGPLIYRLAYQPLAEAPVLVLLIVSVAVHVALVGLGLLVLRRRGLAHAAASPTARFDVGAASRSAAQTPAGRSAPRSR
ncbi:MAG: hypothetical protein MZV49_09540 [Rhodopseudomonas palustris]|nr:hypothetical protein [Rhodopseudomonas palustris]